MANNNGGTSDIFKVVLGLIVLAAAFLIFIILMIVISSNEESGLEMSGMEGEDQSNTELLTDAGKEYYEDEENKKRIDEKVMQLGGSYGIHWVYLESISQQKKTEPEKDDANKCQTKWVGPMKLKELNWVGKQFLEDHPGAKTDLTDCGDINDEMRNQLHNLEVIEKNEKAVNEQCLSDQEEQQKVLFCRPYGVDANGDEKADPENEEDSILATASLLQDYQQTFGNIGQALQQLYGEDEKFLRAVKNNILDWLKDPSEVGVFRWPLSNDVQENKKITKRYAKGISDFTIQSKDGETVYAVGKSTVTEVNQDQGCLTLTHYMGGGNVNTIYCNLKEMEVEKDDDVEIGDEIGTVGANSLIIKMTQVVNDDDENNSNNNPEANPEHYLTAPNDVEFDEKDNQ